MCVFFFSASASSQDTKPRTLQDARDDMESHLVSSFFPEDSTKQRKTGFHQEHPKCFEDHLTWEVIIEIKNMVEWKLGTCTLLEESEFEASPHNRRMYIVKKQYDGKFIFMETYFPLPSFAYILL